MDSRACLLVGLGNPTVSYQWTRHNAGRLLIDFLRQEAGEHFTTFRQADIFRLPNFFGVPLDPPLVCVQLRCYMNESGGPLKSLLNAEGLSLGQTVVVVDDFMLPFGSLRYRASGSAGGHNGLKSIIEVFGTEKFPRLRVGIGPLPAGDVFTDFVLESFTTEEKKLLPAVFKAAKEGLKVLFQEGIGPAQSILNRSHL